MTLKLTDATFMVDAPRADGAAEPSAAVKRRVIARHRDYGPGIIDGFTDSEVDAMWEKLPPDVRQQFLALAD